ncbi:EF-Hand 1, calcium-binding site domain-containing protein [Paramicrosporidium saccamoebae]|uniref:EF-Hand 1, calcium-binding site domain-containing protein n=1 Tax=Paramicrosporidium saccamoebae TaxID=1246581 RepID=A0A2H9TNK2_9FUNG|nr:EF-Hand 1, calcium-binding site domain-containing protein [Paramicrosporidium saccamoebae]
MTSIAPHKKDKEHSKIGELRDMTSQRFDWHEGTFSGYKRGQIWTMIFFHIVLCTVLLLVPIFLYDKGFITGSYPLFASEPPATYEWKLEMLRWAIFAASGYAGFVVTDALAVLCVYGAFYFYSLRGKEAPQKVQRGFDQMIFLYKYVAYFTETLVLLLTSFWLFPLTLDEQAQALFSLGEIKAGSTAGEAAEKLSGLSITNYLKAYSTGHSLQFIVNRAAASLFVLSALILVEKVIIQRISTTFYKRAFGRRLEDNKFALKTTKRLAVAVAQDHGDEKTQSKIIFKRLCPSHRETISMSDIAVHLPTADAERYFGLIDTEATGDMNYEQFERAIARSYSEREDLRMSLLDQDNVIGKLDQLFLVFVWAVAALSWLMLFQVSLRTVLAALTGIGGLVLAVATGTMKTAFESIVFVIFTHPFDVGDQVIIGNEVHYVKELGLWTSTFLGPQYRVTYIANSKLRNEMIINNRRSPFQSERIKFNVVPSTPNDKIVALEAKLCAFLQKNSKDFLPKLNLGGFTIINHDTMTINVHIFHRGNFQDEELRTRRTRTFVLYLRDAISECGITLSPPEEVILRHLK